VSLNSERRMLTTSCAVREPSACRAKHHAYASVRWDAVIAQVPVHATAASGNSPRSGFWFRPQLCEPSPYAKTSRKLRVCNLVFRYFVTGPKFTEMHENSTKQAISSHCKLVIGLRVAGARVLAVGADDRCKPMGLHSSATREQGMLLLGRRSAGAVGVAGVRGD
jgi:hypothetical protein